MKLFPKTVCLEMVFSANSIGSSDHLGVVLLYTSFIQTFMLVLGRRTGIFVPKRCGNTRHITIQQPTTTIIEKPVSLETSSQNEILNEITKVNDSPLSSADEPVLKTFGSPSSVLSVLLPPSIPIHVKKGSIMSIYSKGTASDEKLIKSSWEFDKSLRNLIYGGKFISYQKIMGSIPVQLLISSYDKYSKESSKSFVNLNLDGSTDWCVFKPNSLQCYLGNSLNINVRKVPKNINMKERGYLLLNGRGLVCLTGDGNIFNLSLGANEEIRIDRRNLLAISTNNENDLTSSIDSEIWNSVDGMFHKKDDPKLEPALDSVNLKITNNLYIDEFLSTSWKFCKFLLSFIRKVESQLTHYVMGSGNYIVLKGPRTILMETGCGNDKFVVGSNNIGHGSSDSISQLEKYIKNEEEWKQPVQVKGDNLGVVSIENGRTVYKNVENFDEEVQRIENLKKH